MTSLHGKRIKMFVPVAIFVVTIILIMSSACINPKGANESAPAINATVSVAVTSPQQTPVAGITQQSSEPTSAAQSLWIHIDPLKNITLLPGEEDNYTGPFFINGSTNLPPGEVLSLNLGSTCAWPCPYDPSPPKKIGCCGFDRYTGYTVVQKNYTGMNTWSFLVNTSPDTITISYLNDKVDDNNGIAVSVAYGNETDENYVNAQGSFFMKLQGVP
ncbi:MAG: hypothetical protein WCE65_03460 [Methanoregula sp.]